MRWNTATCRSARWSSRDGEVIATAHNERELRQDPTAHAEIIALREAAVALGSWRVLDSALYVTLEPCAMCAGAIVLARVRAWCSALATRRPARAGSVLDVLGEPRLNHRPEVGGGLLAADECGAAERVLRIQEVSRAAGAYPVACQLLGGVAERLNGSGSNNAGSHEALLDPSGQSSQRCSSTTRRYLCAIRTGCRFSSK